jgi:hypothetical protein
MSGDDEACWVGEEKGWRWVGEKKKATVMPRCQTWERPKKAYLHKHVSC